MGNSQGKQVVFTDEGWSPAAAVERQWFLTCPPSLVLGVLRGIILTFLTLVNLNHFRLLRVVGKGAFGKVRIVERKDTGLTFALKYIRKDEGRCLRTCAEECGCAL